MSRTKHPSSEDRRVEPEQHVGYGCYQGAQVAFFRVVHPVDDQCAYIISSPDSEETLLALDKTSCNELQRLRKQGCAPVGEIIKAMRDWPAPNAR